MNCARVLSGKFIADGVPGYTDFPPGCQKGGSYKRTRNKSTRRNKKKKPTKKPKQTKKKTSVPKNKTKTKKKKVDLIIETICKSMKSKCTPKYKKILRKLVVKNM